MRYHPNNQQTCVRFLQCGYCSFKTTSRVALGKHVEKKHPMDEDDDVPEPPKKRIQTRLLTRVLKKKLLKQLIS